MEPMTVEHIPFFWGVAFSVDMLIGILSFLVVIRKNVPAWNKGTMLWIGWWAWASALSLVINAVEGPNTSFSYHQIGVFTETMTNMGLVCWGVSYLFKNWDVRDTDWLEMEKLRIDISARNREKDIQNAAQQ